MNIARLLWLAACLPLAAHAEFILSVRERTQTAGEPLSLQLTITNSESRTLRVSAPASLNVRIESDSAGADAPFAAERSGTLDIPPQGFATIEYRGAAPAGVQGWVRIHTDDVAAGPTVVELREPQTQGGPPAAAAVSDRKFDPHLVDKAPPLPVSVYEPVYVIVGGDGGLNAKFQISLRYRLFDDRGPLARKLPWIDDLYLSFSQTSLWDLSETSKPFTDSSYRPRLFFANYDLARLMDGRLRFGMESGLAHESNGKDGEDSRSVNMLYLRPTMSFGDPDGLRAYVGPLIHNYIADDDNSDLKDYRGYVDWQIGVGSKGGLDFWATLRKGARSDYGSIELNASYPLSKLSGGDLTGWLLLQYFGGYGESLLNYAEKLDSQLRLGLAVAL